MTDRQLNKYIMLEEDNICDIEWIHNSEGEQFNDGFSDDYVFEPEKIYPRLRKNFADNPLENVSLMATTESSPDYPDNLIMFRIMDSFIGVIMVDLGDHYTYFTYDMLPENMTPKELEDIAFKNLSENVQYRQCESKEKGIFGIVAGGNFEAESILFNDIWEENQKKTPYLIFCRDIFIYSRESKKINVSSEYKL